MAAQAARKWLNHIQPEVHWWLLFYVCFASIIVLDHSATRNRIEQEENECEQRKEMETNEKKPSKIQKAYA